MHKGAQVLLIGSLAVNGAGAALLAWKVATRAPPARGEELYTERRVSLFGVLTQQRADVVLLGDSLTDAGEWTELLALDPKVRVANRGIAGDTTEDVIDRLEAVTRLEPRVVAILIGINDLLQGRSPADVAANVDRILSELRGSLPRTTLLVQGLLPTAAHVLDAAVLDDVNRRYAELAARRGATYLEVGDDLGAWLSEDGLHLTGTGYRLWAQALRPHLARAVEQ